MLEFEQSAPAMPPQMVGDCVVVPSAKFETPVTLVTRTGLEPLAPVGVGVGVWEWASKVTKLVKPRDSSKPTVRFENLLIA
jgi:hypothetical protein